MDSKENYKKKKNLPFAFGLSLYLLISIMIYYINLNYSAAPYTGILLYFTLFFFIVSYFSSDDYASFFYLTCTIITGISALIVIVSAFLFLLVAKHPFHISPLITGNLFVTLWFSLRLIFSISIKNFIKHKEAAQLMLDDGLFIMNTNKDLKSNHYPSMTWYSKNPVVKIAQKSGDYLAILVFIGLLIYPLPFIPLTRQMIETYWIPTLSIFFYFLSGWGAAASFLTFLTLRKHEKKTGKRIRIVYLVR